MECIILIGLPGSGKSTFVQDYPHHAHISSDKYIDEYAKSMNKTHDDVYDHYRDTATKLHMKEFQKAVKNKKNIIVDRTNLAISSRKRYISQLSNKYKKIAIVFPKIINLDREGKHIPASNIFDMAKMFVYPTIEEGFDIIKEYNIGK